MRSIVIYFLFAFVAFSIFVFSYFWLDLSLVLMISGSHGFEDRLINLIHFGQSNRWLLSHIYIILVITYFSFQVLLFLKWADQISTKRLLILAAMTSLIFSLSYNFLSHDIFSYLFSAKLVWVYHTNPYTTIPRAFYLKDVWLGFNHALDSTYAYGVLSLFYTLIPLIIFSASRFLLVFFGLRILNFIIFFCTGCLLLKMLSLKKMVFSLWFFNPLLTIELLVNAHNDLLMVSGFIVAMYFLYKMQRLQFIIIFILTTFTKSANIFISPNILGLPAVFLNKFLRNYYFKFALCLLFLFLSLSNYPIQNWYFCWIYMFLPFINLKKFSWILIYLIGAILILSYHSFLETNWWGAQPFPLFDSHLLSIEIFALIVLWEAGIIQKRWIK